MMRFPFPAINDRKDRTATFSKIESVSQYSS